MQAFPYGIRRFLNVQKSLGGHKRFYNFAVMKAMKCRLAFLCVLTLVHVKLTCKISCKNSKWLLRKWQITLGYTFLPHTVCFLFFGLQLPLHYSIPTYSVKNSVNGDQVMGTLNLYLG